MALACLAVPGIVAAANVNVSYTGTIDYVAIRNCPQEGGGCELIDSPRLDFRGGTVRAGDTFAGSLHYDSAWAPEYTEPERASYAYDPVFAADMTLSLGSVSFPAPGSVPTFGGLIVFNDVSCCGGWDELYLYQYFDDDVSQAAVDFFVYDGSGTTFGGTALPGSLGLAGFDYTYLSLTVGDHLAVGHLTSLQSTSAAPVPEPSTLALLFVGVAWLLAHQGIARRRG
jgi:hypothetical protein